METLQYGKYYHIYNRGNNREDIFKTHDNYLYFLRLYEKYIDPVAETYAWVLMGNHFHLLVRMKDEEEINTKTLAGFRTLRGLKTQGLKAQEELKNEKLKFPHLYFSHLFNAYTQAYNKMFNRTGSLFEKRFKRIEIKSEKYFKQLVVYIHYNPVHHGFTDNFKDYPWSSYGTIVSDKATRLQRNKLLSWFDNKVNFVNTHEQKQEPVEIEELMFD